MTSVFYKRFNESMSKTAVIRSYPEQNKTRDWLESLSDDQWFVIGYDPKVREVLLSVTGIESNEVHTVSLTIPAIV